MVIKSIAIEFVRLQAHQLGLMSGDIDIILGYLIGSWNSKEHRAAIIGVAAKGARGTGPKHFFHFLFLDLIITVTMAIK